MCLSFVITIAAAEARAQSFISPFVGYNFGGDSACEAANQLPDCEEKNLNYGVGFGRMGNVVGFEEEFGYARNFFGEAPGFSSSVLTVMSNFMVVPNLGPVRPFGLVGLGLIKSKVEFTPSSLLDADNNHFGWNVGGGLRFPLTGFSAYVEARYHSTSDFKFTPIVFGLQF